MTQPKEALIRVYWKALKPKSEDIKVQYNPTEYTFDKSVLYGEQHIPKLDSPLQHFVRGQAERLTLDLFFDTTKYGMGAGATSVATETDKIYQLLKIEPKEHEPPVLEFIWSDQMAGAFIGGAVGGGAGGAGRVITKAVASSDSATGPAMAATGSIGASAGAAAGTSLGGQRRAGFRCVLESVKQKFTLFSPEGVPLRATLTVSFREHKTLCQQLDELQLSSPDRTHVHVLQQGETLAAVSNQYYDTPVDWRSVAIKNGIDDPRRLTPGTFLNVPPLV